MPAWTKTDKDRLSAWRLRGDSAAEIAGRLCRSLTSVKQAIIRFGLADKPRRWGRWDSLRLKTLRLAGKTDREIASITGWSVAAVMRRRKRLGLTGRLEDYASRPKQLRAMREAIRERSRSVCVERGWPQAGRPSDCDVLDVLEKLHRATSRRVRIELGLLETTAKSRINRLRRLGLVVPVGKRDGGFVWELADGVKKVVKKEAKVRGRNEGVFAFGV